MLLPLVASLILSPLAGDSVTLARKFAKGEAYTYEVKSRLQIETRGRGLETFIPEDLELTYKFTTKVVDTKADGIVVMQYQRPTMTQIEGETFDNPTPRKTVENVGYDFLLTVSPINEIIDMKEQAKRKAGWAAPAGASPATSAGLQVMNEFVIETYRLALCVGNFDSSLDFAPKLPFEDVKVGDTWHRTASYQPQRLKGQSKTAVQRLDYTYTYNGLQDVEGKKFHRVTATLKLDTDLATFYNEAIPGGQKATGLKKMPLKMDATINFDLDPKTFRTVKAVAESTGGFELFATKYADAVVEQRLKGRTIMRLAPPAK